MRKTRKHSFRRILALVLVLAMLPIYSAFSVEGKVQEYLEPGAEVEQEMCEAFLDYLHAKKDGANYTLEDVQVDEYYGNYSGYEIAQMGFVDWAVTYDMAYVKIAGYLFTFSSGSYPQYFLACKDGEMLLVKDAYEQEFLSKEDIFDLAVFRGDAIRPDQCTEHETNGAGGKQATADSQGRKNPIVCQKCYTVLEEGEWLPTLSKTRYEDIEAGSWYCKCVDYCDQNGIMVGVDDNNFDPARTITRSEFVSVLYRIAGKPEVTQANTFTDVPAESYYANAVSWGVENGIVYGTSETTYSPDLPITREDIACLIARYVTAIDADFLHDGIIAELSFTDGDKVSDYAKDSVTLVAHETLMVGNAGGMFKPQDKATRAEVASVFMSLHKKLAQPEQAYLQVGDREDAWVYTLPDDDADKFRNILNQNDGTWTEVLRCECIGKCQLVLDGVRYWIDWDDITHQIKYQEVYGGVSGAVETADEEVLNELGALLWGYKFIYELVVG